MKCYYEVLQLERNSNLDQIKRSYKKLALQWHPDKNLDNSEECQAQFTLIQQAYDVLSDPQERAWYDRHREKILKGGIDGDYQDNAVNLFPFFTSSCYQGFGDGEKGFYTVYRQLFEQIAAEDLEFEENPGEISIPGFGESASDFDTVVGPFYGHWQSYTTSRSYVWVDKYDFKQAPDRRTWRMMEKENKKLRQAAKKERNELVRELVAFVRKRDKRVHAQRKLQEEKRAEQLKRVNELAAEQRRLKLLQFADAAGDGEHVARFDEQHLDALDEIEAGWESEASTSEAESESDLYCVACEKSFRSEKALKNHQNSKKHLENVELLRATLQKEDMDLLNLEDFDGGDEESVDPQQTGAKTKKSKRKKKKNKLDVTEEKDSFSSSSEFEQSPTDVGEQADQEKGSEDRSGQEEILKTAQMVQKVEDVGDPKDKAARSDAERKMPPAPVEARCKTCSEEFPSKSKLFKHLTDTGHAVIRPEFLTKPKKQAGKNKKLKR